MSCLVSKLCFFGANSEGMLGDVWNYLGQHLVGMLEVFLYVLEVHAITFQTRQNITTSITTV